MCFLLKICRSAYYKWLKKKKLVKEKELYDLDTRIKNSFKKSRATYGSPRIAIDLAEQGIEVSESTVARRMKVLRISPKRRKRFIPTTDSNHQQAIAPNHLNREFSAEKIAQKWVSDLTYFRVGKSWHYLTVIIDLADRAVVGWTISNNMTAEHTIIQAFKNALNKRKPLEGMLFHSDRGVQYACKDFKDLLIEQNCIQSMSRKGNCWDNAVAESFFKTIKTECIYRHQFTSLQKAYSILFDYIEGWFNTCRIHTSIQGKAPDQMNLILNSNKHAA